jgi:hypothetical protein
VLALTVALIGPPGARAGSAARACACHLGGRRDGCVRAARAVAVGRADGACATVVVPAGQALGACLDAYGGGSGARGARRARPSVAVLGERANRTGGARTILRVVAPCAGCLHAISKKVTSRKAPMDQLGRQCRA